MSVEARARRSSCCSSAPTASRSTWPRRARARARSPSCCAAPGGARELDARVDLVRVGPLQLRAVALHKDDDDLRGEATVSDADLAAALPRQLALRPVDDPARRARARGVGAGVFTARARLSARDGALVIAPEGLLGGLGSLTLFRDSRVQVTEVGSKPGAGRLHADRRRAAADA